LALTKATTSAARNDLLSCSLVTASGELPENGAAGCGNVIASATPSPGSLTLCVPLLIISIISLNPFVTLVSAVTLSSTSGSART